MNGIFGFLEFEQANEGDEEEDEEVGNGRGMGDVSREFLIETTKYMINEMKNSASFYPDYKVYRIFVERV
uniref:TCTP domain-containing protein n=1 Tax=Caenorhabditis tropicalis TaxID=1561998 RepID=A0A1I7UB21_9PELO